MMTFTNEELQKLDAIKIHIILQAEKNGVKINEVVTDKIALQYALSLAEMYINELQPELKVNKKRFGFKKTNQMS